MESLKISKAIFSHESKYFTESKSNKEINENEFSELILTG